MGRSALREAFRQVRRSRPFKVVAVVLLPDHPHTVWELPRGDTDYTTRWRQIKTLVTRALVGRIGDGAISASRRRRAEKGIWQRRFCELRFIVMCDLANTPSSGAAATHGMAMNSAAWNDWCVQARTLPCCCYTVVGCHGWLVQPCRAEPAKRVVPPFGRQAVDGRQAGVWLRRIDEIVSGGRGCRAERGHRALVRPVTWCRRSARACWFPACDRTPARARSPRNARRA